MRDKVRKAGVVLWIDSEGHYTRFVDAFEEAPSDFAYPVVGLRGSFLELMLALEHYCNGLQPEHLLVHRPALNKETVKETPIYELHKAGTVFESARATTPERSARSRRFVSKSGRFALRTPLMERFRHRAATSAPWQSR